VIASASAYAKYVGDESAKWMVLGSLDPDPNAAFGGFTSKKKVKKPTKVVKKLKKARSLPTCEAHQCQPHVSASPFH
jgi:hypothetical protein